MSHTGPWRLPESWEWVRIGEITDVVGGGTPSTADPANWEDGKVPWITPADLSGYRDVKIARGGRFITERGLTGSGARLMPAGTVLLSSRAPVGYVAIAASSLSTNQGFKSFLPSDALLPEYLYYYLLANRDLILEFASGTTFQEVSGRKAALIPVPIAPLAQQRRIVAATEEHLSRLDAAVAGLKRVQAQLPRYRAAVLKSAVEVAANGEATRQAPLAEIAEVIDYGSSARTSETGEVPVLRMGNISQGKLVCDSLKYLPEKHYEFPKLILQPGDLLFNRTNSAELVGKTAVYTGTPKPCSFASYLIRVRLKGDCLPDYVAAVLNSPYGRAWIRSVVSQQVGQANVSGGKLKTFPVPLPTFSAQQRIVEETDRRLTLLDVVAREVAAALEHADYLRDCLLHSAFSGQLVPQDPNDEPATVLLERIRAARARTQLSPSRRSAGATKS